MESKGKKPMGEGPCWKCGGACLQRDCPTFPQNGWAGAGYQSRSLYDPVRGQFSCLTAVDPAPKEKEAKEEKKTHHGSTTSSGFRFFDPSLADDDDDDDDDTATKQSDEGNNKGIGSFAGAQVEKATHQL